MGKQVGSLGMNSFAQGSDVCWHQFIVGLGNLPKGSLFILSMDVGLNVIAKLMNTEILVVSMYLYLFPVRI